MVTIMDEPIQEEANVEGTVKVIRRLPASTLAVWQALTDPEVVSRWFGALAEPLRPNGRTHLDFDDGDFFTLEGIRLDPPHSLKYAWRFLGIGPLDTITWELIPKESSCLVTVTDSEPGRSPEMAEQLRKGWLDFTNRLRKLFTHGTRTRYSLRSEFEASIELSDKIETVQDLLFKPEMQPQWLPVDVDGLRNGARFSAATEQASTQFQISNVEWTKTGCVAFDLAHPSWLKPTNCQIKLIARGDDTLLSVSQGDWKEISADDEIQKRDRKRFSSTWINACRRAQFLVDWRKTSERW
jgi:uncharacterized protein YndB with AHSA1/START domain